MKRTFKSLLAAGALAFVGLGSLLTSSPAHAVPPTCSPVTIPPSNAWPRDGSHAFRCKNTTTNVQPTDARTAEYFLNIQNLPVKVKDVLISRGVKFFFFNNRDEANEYFNATAPYAGRPNGVFASTTARCGQTGYHPTLGIFGELQQTIAVAIYDLCTVTQVAGPYKNPDLKRIPYHEAGHAFDFALASQKTNGRGVSVSSATGSQSLFAIDKDKLTPFNWFIGVPAMTQSQRYNYLCNLFSISKPSGLEIDLGFTTNTGGPSGQVCQTVSLPYPVFQPIAKSPSVVAAEKFPYFWNDPKESWAELFVIVATGSSSSGPNTLPTVDRVYGMNQSPVRSFNCTRAVIQWYISNANTSTSAPLPEPTAANLPAGCTPTGPLR